MGTTSRSLAGKSAGRVICAHCGKAWPAETTMCSCGAAVDDTVNETDETVTEKTVLDDAADRYFGPAAPPVRSLTSLTSVAADSESDTSTVTTRARRDDPSADPPIAQPGSDPTTTGRIDTGFVHLVPGTLVGEYEVERLLGSGGMGAVYGARHERLGKKAAIKVIAPNLSADQSAVERFEQEALALARLSHPNIVAVLSIGTLPGDRRSYYAMEWLDGDTLHDCIKRGDIPFDAALDILDQIARGLDAAHAAGIVHRDLKPANCWLQRVRDEPRRVVKILDLGLAKLAEHRRSQETAVNVMFGTADYMSPEQCQSTRDVGPETDVYALGCIGYELLCGRLPFAYDNAAELVVAHCTETPPTPRSLDPTMPAEMGALLTAMIAKDPSHRPPLARVRETIAAVRSSQARATSAAEPGLRAGTAQPNPDAIAAAPVSEPRASRRAVAAIAGLVALGAIVAAVTVGSGGAKLDARAGVAQPRATIEVDAGASLTATAASTALDASVPLPIPAPPIDANAVAPLKNGDSASSAVAEPLPDGGARASEPPIVVDPEPKTTPAGTPVVDAGVAPTEDLGPIVVAAPVSQAATSPPNREPPATAKRPPSRDVIVNPFKKKPVTR